MPQELSQQQIQEQKLVQQQRITQQQLLNAKLLAMPLAELEQSINAEIDENPALERVLDDDNADAYGDIGDAFDGGADSSADQEDFRDELNTALENMESDDEVVEKDSFYPSDAAVGGDIYGSSTSFRDKLMEQVGELTLSDSERSIMEYLVDSLDDDGLLRKDIESIVDELAIYEYIDTSSAVVERLLRELQTFDPAGVGAQNLQECLRLQIERRADSRLKDYMLDVVDHHFASFMRRRWDKIQTSLRLNDTQISTLKEAFQHLNPKPGAALGESLGVSKQTITPDVIIYSDHDGHVFFDLNTSHLPSLALSDTFVEMQANYQKVDIKTLPRADRDAMVYVSRNVDRATRFMEAVHQRQQTLEKTMRVIISLQKKYLLSGEESDLRPMILKDIAERTGLDISTISRVSNEKYVQTQWGIFPIKHFFSDGIATDEGEERSSRAVKQALKDIVAEEDKACPKSDEALVIELRKRGFAVARRTVAKYREQLGIPTSHLRKD